MARPRRSSGLPAHLRPPDKKAPKPPAGISAEQEALIEDLRASAVSVEDLEEMRLSTEDLDRLLGEKPRIERLVAPTRTLATPHGTIRVKNVGTLTPEEAALTRAIEALEEVAARVNKRQRERLAGFRRYLENLPRQQEASEEETEARRQGKRIGRKAFAALVGVSPKTLLDWHTSGAFEPAYIDPKGWRFYTFEQVGEAKALLRKRKR